MEKVGMNSIEVLMTIGLVYGMLKFWKWKLQGGYDIELNNNAYGIFLGGQLLALLLIIIGSIDPQNSAYLEGLTMFGDGALNYWTAIGVQVFGVVIIYMLSNVISHLMFNITLKAQSSIYDEIALGNFAAAIVISILTLIIGYVSSYFLLRTYLFEWVNTSAGLVPLT
jgi:hypothetical protein